MTELGELAAAVSEDYINEFGAEVELDSIDFTGTADAYGDTPQAFTTSTVMAFLEDNVRRDRWGQLGLLQDGDMIMTVIASSGAKVRDLVVLNSITFDVVEVRQVKAAGSTMLIKLALKRRHDNA